MKIKEFSIVIFISSISLCSCQNIEKKYIGNFFTINTQKNDTVYFQSIQYNFKNNKIEVSKNKFYYPERDLVINTSVLGGIGVKKENKIKFYEFSQKTKNWIYQEKMDFTIPNIATNIQSVAYQTIALTENNKTLIYEFDPFEKKWSEHSEKKHVSDQKILLFDDKISGLMKNNTISFFDFKNKKWVKSDLIPNVTLEKNPQIISFGLLYIMTINKDNCIDLYLNKFPKWSVYKNIELE